ncbi:MULTISPECIES: hypothetical protein [Sphingomonadales]|uniref:hypothetical protein n=1 Tax=Sphingomonadales TaxID=204457 RepID=UPI0015959E4A|nr:MULTISPECIES: hypothetical protein [Sphingomonadales]MBA4757607.1 hypothetical protein [Sphingosinicella sp.]
MAMVDRRGPSRGAVLGRTIAALGGGYLLASLWASLLAIALPGPAVEASLAASLSAYILFVLVALWAFVPRRGWTVWASVAGAATALFALGSMVGR